MALALVASVSHATNPESNVINLSGTVGAVCDLRITETSVQSMPTGVDGQGVKTDIAVSHNFGELAASAPASKTFKLWEECNQDYNIDIESANGGLKQDDISAGTAQPAVHQYTLTYNTDDQEASLEKSAAELGNGAVSTPRPLDVDPTSGAKMARHAGTGTIGLSSAQDANLPTGSYSDTVTITMDLQ